MEYVCWLNYYFLRFNIDSYLPWWSTERERERVGGSSNYYHHFHHKINNSIFFWKINITGHYLILSIVEWEEKNKDDAIPHADKRVVVVVFE